VVRFLGSRNDEVLVAESYDHKVDVMAQYYDAEEAMDV